MGWALTISLIANGLLIGCLMAEWKHGDNKQLLINALFIDLKKVTRALQILELLSDKETIREVQERLGEEAKNETNRDRKES